MTYSLNTLNADRRDAPAGSGIARFAQEIGLVLGAAALAFWLLSLLSHSLADPAWSTTGSRGEVWNWGGRLGALVADASYFLFGFSVWWLFAAGVRTWLSALARWLRGVAPTPDSPRWWQRPAVRRLAFWGGLIALVTIVNRPVASAGGSSTEGVEKLACDAHARPHWPQ